MLPQAREGLEERFSKEKWSKSGLITRLLGLHKYGRAIVNLRPNTFGSTVPLLDDVGGQGKLENIGVAMLSHGRDGVVAASVFNLVKVSRRDKEPWAVEVILFAVKKAIEHQRVAKRLEAELFRYAAANRVERLIVLNAKRVGQSKNWWLEKGGFEKNKPERCSILSTFTSLTAFCKSRNGGALKQVPDSLMCAHTPRPRPRPLRAVYISSHASLHTAFHGRCTRTKGLSVWPRHALAPRWSN